MRTKSFLDTILPDGLMPTCNFRGKFGEICKFIKMLATTWPVETDKDWWEVRLLTMCWS